MTTRVRIGHVPAAATFAVSDRFECARAVDIWAAGCILAELLAQKPLFQGKNCAFSSLAWRAPMRGDALRAPPPHPHPPRDTV